MREETEQQFRRLAKSLRATRDQPGGGAVLLIGGESSTIDISSEPSTIDRRPALEALRRFVLQNAQDPEPTEKQLDKQDIQEQIQQFDTIWDGLSILDRMGYWKQLTTVKEVEAANGLSYLAKILKERYFPIVLTTSVDQLFEARFHSDTFEKNRLLRQLSTFILGPHPVETIKQAILNNDAARTTILIKLYGDFQYSQVSITRNDASERAREPEFASVLSVLLNERQLNLVVVGLTPLDDAYIASQFPSVSGKVTFIGRSHASFQFFQNHPWKKKPDYILDPDLTFDTIFETIDKYLGIGTSFVKATGSQPDEDILDRAEQEALSKPLPEVVGGMVKAQKEKAEKERAQKERAQKEEDLLVKPQTPLIEILDDSEEAEKGKEEGEIFAFVSNTLFTVRADTSNQADFEVRGGGLKARGDGSGWRDSDVAEINQATLDLGYDLVNSHRLADAGGFERWRRRVKTRGMDLYKDLVQAYPDLDRNLAIANSAVENEPSNLTLIFEGPRTHLGIPYELLHTEKTYLALDHPLCRVVSGIPRPHTETFEQFMRELRKKKQPLRVLLIASGVTDQSLAVDQEIDELKAIIVRQAQRLAIRVEEPKMIYSGSASYQEVKKHLTARDNHHNYHIVHYAGQSKLDETTTENGGLFLWKQTFRGKERVFVPARELASWLEVGETRLFYLSSCTGAWTGDLKALTTNGYLGILDAAAQKGVPYVLGFRWYVPDTISRDFTRAFYDELFKRPNSPERAVWKARNKLNAANGERIETWASPILIAQNPYFAQ